MMDIQIEPLNENTYKDAARIAYEANTGNKADIHKRLLAYYRYFVALYKDKVIGEIGWYQDKGSFAGKALGDNFPHGQQVYWLSHFAVDTPFRRKGIGKLLLNFLEQEIKKHGGNELWVYSTQASDYYKKNGFTFVQKAWIDNCWQDVLKKKMT